MAHIFYLNKNYLNHQDPKKNELDKRRQHMKVISVDELRGHRLFYLLKQSYYVAVVVHKGNLMMDAVTYMENLIKHETVSRPSDHSLIESTPEKQFGTFCLFNDRGADKRGGGYVVFGPTDLNGEQVHSDTLFQMIHQTRDEMDTILDNMDNANTLNPPVSNENLREVVENMIVKRTIRALHG
jgi:hypothetical protein